MISRGVHCAEVLQTRFRSVLMHYMTAGACWYIAIRKLLIYYYFGAKSEFEYISICCHFLTFHQKYSKSVQKNELLMDVFLQNNRLEHVFQVMSLHPQYLECFLRSHRYLLHEGGPLPNSLRHYIAVMVGLSPTWIHCGVGLLRPLHVWETQLNWTVQFIWVESFRHVVT
jgi:PA26 p53-induced protein (sestrin)